MKITLTYRGVVPSAHSGGGKNKSAHISNMRLAFHEQLKRLWGQPPFGVLKKWEDTGFEANAPNFIKAVGGIKYVPFFDLPKIGIAVSLDITLLSGEPNNAPQLISKGDLDNRIKSIIDALHPPQKDNLSGSEKELNRIYCLMGDDEAVKELTATTRPFLASENHDDAFVLVEVRPVPIEVTQSNIEMSL
ncbi:hypothetical protein MXMO3_00019 [Maritalea myrionectae]|uniref:Uncharacterized protein n=1 Tax=Maritalea myrionectae TaxID=454601 RepID=A0A2R4M956_9HYPH|nr:hypothetical protein [Maritalea myrionectae]AVX02568.1 hypothetical protein MXMO3_00019 [Maritalea myrionectae]